MARRFRHHDARTEQVGGLSGPGRRDRASDAEPWTPEQDVTRGRSAGTVENPLRDPTRGRSAGTPENPLRDPMRAGSARPFPDPTAGP